MLLHCNAKITPKITKTREKSKVPRGSSIQSGLAFLTIWSMVTLVVYEYSKLPSTKSNHQSFRVSTVYSEELWRSRASRRGLPHNTLRELLNWNCRKSNLVPSGIKADVVPQSHNSCPVHRCPSSSQIHLAALHPSENLGSPLLHFGLGREHDQLAIEHHDQAGI